MFIKAKVVVGNGEHGLPVILNSDVTGASSSASTPPAGGLAKTEELFTKMRRANNPDPSLTTPVPAPPPGNGNTNP